MSPDSSTSTTAHTATPTDSDSASAPEHSPNDAVIDAIRAHHEQLAGQLRVRTDAVVTTARTGDCSSERDALHEWYRRELMPHVVAEEQALYGPAADLPATRLLTRGMLAEHRFLEGLIAGLVSARDPLRMTAGAVAAQAVFTVHLSKENDLLLPALDEAGIELRAILDGMHEIVGHPHGAGRDGCGCGSGCGCRHDGGEAQPEPRPGSAPSEQAGGDLDVRALPHGQRHEIIFTRLDQLRPGQSLVIVNDHDPKPLRYQAEAMWPDGFAWSYLRAGPTVWRVAITRAR